MSDEMVSVPMKDLALAIRCGMSFDTRFPYGIPPKSLTDVLSDEMYSRVIGERSEEEKNGRGKSV